VEPICNSLSRFGRLGPIGVFALILFPVGQAAYRVAFPWHRAETGPAAAYVREHIQANEPLIGNAWEDAYYFRDGRITYFSSETVEQLPYSRIWLMATTDDAAARRAILQKIRVRGPWRVLAMKRFERVHVYHLEHLAPDGLPDP